MARKPIDLVGEAFGRLTVVQQAESGRDSRGRNVIRWECVCSCGAMVTLPGASLRSGNTRSCGCLRRETTSERSRDDITGQKFGLLRVLRLSEARDGKTYWWCVCECGVENEFVRANLLTGNTKSCGCLNHKRMNGPVKTSHGYLKAYAPQHPRADKNGRVREHHLNMESLLGRYLVPGEEIHHLNGDRADNRIDGPLREVDGRWRSGNLELWSTSQPAGQRIEDKVQFAKEILALYEPEALAS